MDVSHRMYQRRINIRETTSGDFELAVPQLELEEIIDYLNEIRVPFRVSKEPKESGVRKRNVALVFGESIGRTVLLEVIEHFYDGFGIVEFGNVEP